MNERIRELAKEAGIFYYRKGKLQVDMEKFAELIVGECMTMCTELQAQYLTSRKSTMDFDEKNIYAEGESACDILRHKMKSKFGVEL